MSTPIQRPISALTGSGSAKRAAGVTVLSGAATVGALTFGGAPWWAVTITASLSIVVAGFILVVQATFPDDSAHKRDLWLAVLRHWDRRAVRKVKHGESAARKNDRKSTAEARGPSSRLLAPVTLRPHEVPHDR